MRHVVSRGVTWCQLITMWWRGVTGYLAPRCGIGTGTGNCMIACYAIGRFCIGPGQIALESACVLQLIKLGSSTEVYVLLGNSN